MENKKLTDSEIIKALEELIKNFCNTCKHKNCEACSISVVKQSLDLINRQNAKIEYQKAEIDLLHDEGTKAYNEVNRLQAENERLIGDVITYKVRWAKATVKLDTAKAEAYKEFADRLKIFVIPQLANGYTREIVLKRDIDNLLKELVGDEQYEE